MKAGIKIGVLAAVLLLASTAWGQVNISPASIPSSGTTSTARNTGVSPTTTTHTPDSTATADSNGMEGLKGIEYHVDPPDSVLQASVFGFHRRQGHIGFVEFQHPTLSPTGAQFSDQLDAMDGNHYLTVTELGHPHLALFANIDRPLGLAFRKCVYPAFYKTPDNIVFYQVQKPYTLLSYNSSLDKDYQVHVTHTQNINQRWNFALDYHLFSPQGVFSNSSATDHLVDLNTNYYSRDARYQVAAALISQRMVLGENGGLSNESIFVNKQISNMGGVPMAYTNRYSNSNDLTLSVRQSFNTVRQFEWYRPIHETFIDTIEVRDTLRVVAELPTATDTVWKDSVSITYRYDPQDSIVGYDTLQPHAPHVYNTGVVALELQWDKQKYRCADSSLYHRLTASFYWTNDAYADRRWRNPLKLYGGVRPQLSWLQLDETQYSSASVNRTVFYPFARMEISPWPMAELNLYAEASPNLEEYNLDARLLFPKRDSVGNTLRSLMVRAVVQAANPELIYYAQCLLTGSTVQAESLQPVGVRKVEADYRQHSLQVYVAAQHVGHNIWLQYDTLSDGTTALQPHQSASGALLLQGRLNMQLRLTRWLHYDMQQLLQYSSDQEQIRVPLFASKNSLYADFLAFHGALHTQVGFDLRYHTLFRADGYDPLLGQFYRQDEVDVGNYLWADFFINLQVKRASIYAKAGHFNAFLEQQGYCLLPHYPSKQFGFYFGMTWKFFD